MGEFNSNCMFRSTILLITFVIFTSLQLIQAQGSAYKLELDGANDYVNCGVVNLSGTALTMECWVKFNSFKGNFPYITSLVGIEGAGTQTALMRMGG